MSASRLPRWQDPTPAGDDEILRLLAAATSPILRRVLEADAKKRGLL
jgi:hypothetical protein